MFDHLTRLAYDRSPERRAELLYSLTDLFAGAGARVEEGIAEIYSEIVEHLLPGVSDAERGEIAFRLADLTTAPRGLILRLAGSDIVVAEPVLRLSRVLTDCDLAALAACLPQTHLVAIAARRPVSEQVTDALVLHGDADVRKAIVQNRGARLSAQGLARLVADAGTCDLSERPMAVASGRDGGAVVPFRLDRRTSRRMHGAGGPSGVLLSFPRMAERRKADAVESGHPVATVIAAIASSDRMLEVAILLAEHAGLPADLVSRLIARSDPTLLAVLCRAAGVSQDTFAVIARIRGCRFGHSGDEIAGVERVYARLTAAEAHKALRWVRRMQEERSAAAVPAS